MGTELLDRVVWPLRHAKGSYALGNYLGTLALCGTVAEMMAILLFDVSRTRVGERELDSGLQQRLFGGKFEKLGQQRRVEVLLGLGLIDVETKAAYDLIRTTRNKYLHLYSAQHDDLARDARSVFDASVTVVANGIGQEIRDGMIIFRDSMVRFMEERGLLDAESPAADRPERTTFERLQAPLDLPTGQGGEETSDRSFTRSKAPLRESVLGPSGRRRAAVG